MLIFALVFVLVFAALAFVILRPRNDRAARLIGGIRRGPAGTPYTGPRYNAHGRSIS